MKRRHHTHTAEEKAMQRRSYLPHVLLIAVLLIAGNATAAWAGASMAPLISTHHFGTTTVGSPVVRDVTIINWGDATGVITGGFIPNGYSAVLIGPSTVPPGGQTYIRVTLLAQQVGTYNSSVGVYYQDADFPFGFGNTGFGVTGTVTAPCTTPTVSITNPTNGSTKSPNAAGNVILNASASDPSGITSVRFYVDGALVATDTAAPWAYAWPAKGGSHQVYARATNSCGNSRNSSTVTFSVNCGNPTVTLTSPANGSTVTPNGAGKVILRASASHSTGIQKVAFWVDGSRVAVDQSGPTWAYAWPATSGPHSAWAKAFSNCGSTRVSAHNSFTVQ